MLIGGQIKSRKINLDGFYAFQPQKYVYSLWTILQNLKNSKGEANDR